jgi:multidrug efflux system membrane fusion protein
MQSLAQRERRKKTETLMLKSLRWTCAGIGLVAAASVAMFAVFGEPPFSYAASAVSPGVAEQAVPVSVITVRSQTVRLWEDFSGRLEAVDRVDVRARVSGAVKAVHFREGALVKAGDPLFSIDPAPYQAIVAQAEGQVELARAKVGLAETELDRGHRLSGNHTISQSDLDQRQSALAEAKASLSSATANLQAAQLDLGYAEVKAPVAGRIGKIDVTVGNLVAAGSTSAVLAKLVSVDPIYASFDASEDLVTMALAELPSRSGSLPAIEDIPVEAGTLADKGTPLKGTLQLVDNEVNAASGTITVRAVFPNPRGTLIPGQFVRIRMGESMPQNRLLVPDRAISTDQDKKFVYVVDTKNHVAYRSVTLGGLVDGKRIVQSGLSDGETIVVGGLQRVRPNALVAPTVVQESSNTD